MKKYIVIFLLFSFCNAASSLENTDINLPSTIPSSLNNTVNDVEDKGRLKRTYSCTLWFDPMQVGSFRLEKDEGRLQSACDNDDIDESEIETVLGSCGRENIFDEATSLFFNNPQQLSDFLNMQKKYMEQQDKPVQNMLAAEAASASNTSLGHTSPIAMAAAASSTSSHPQARSTTGVPTTPVPENTHTPVLIAALTALQSIDDQKS